jgi:hypothetical protein
VSIVVFCGLAERGVRVCFFCGDDTTVGVLCWFGNVASVCLCVLWIGESQLGISLCKRLILFHMFVK